MATQPANTFSALFTETLKSAVQDNSKVEEPGNNWLRGFGEPKYWKYKETIRGYLCGRCADGNTECTGGCEMDAAKRAWCFHNAEALQAERAMLDEGD